MRWSETIAPPTDRRLREFAASGAAVCLALAGWQLYRGNSPLAGALLLAALVAGGLGIFRARWLAPPFRAALIVTFPLALGVSLLVLAVIFYGLFTPLALLFRLFGRDALQRRTDTQAASYWKPKPPVTDPRRYLRQY